MKNPENKPLRIRFNHQDSEEWVTKCHVDRGYFALVLSQLAVAQSNLVKAGKDSAMPHFIAIVKEIERLYDFQFTYLD